jgi:outer membrane protein insertion porin family
MTSRLKFGRRGHFVRVWVCGLAIIGASGAAMAQAPVQLPITRVSITNVGPQTVSEALVRANIKIKEGDNYNPASVNDDIRNLYGTGYFLNVRVSEQRTVDGVELLYVLQPRPKLADINFVGNKKYSKAKLSKKVTSKIGEPFDERKIFMDKQEILKMYQKAGYPQTKVEYTPNVDPATGRASITFDITETPKVRIQDVYFEGAHAFSQKKLRKVLKTRRHWLFSWLTGTGVLKDDQLEEDKERLSEFYRNEGYIDFEMKDLRFVYETPRKLVLHFVISEGQQYRVGAVEFKGPKLFTTNEIASKLKMGVGSTFTPVGLNKDIEAIQDLYGTKGYIDTKIFARKNPNTQTGTMDLSYEIDEADKSYIEKIEIKGNTKTKDRVIRRELAVSPGEEFNMVKVKLSKRRLEGTQFFEHVDAQPEPTDIPNRKNLVIGVNEQNTGNFTIGAGFSSVDSILGFAEVTQNNFDLFNPPWFQGGGQKMRLKATLGTVRREYEATFIEPWFLGKKLQLSVDLYHSELDFVSLNDFYNERLTGARIGLTRALGSDFLIGGISYNIENRGIVDVSSNAPAIIQDPFEKGYHLVSKVGTSLAYDTRNSTLLPNAGQRTEIRSSVAGGPLGGDRDFYNIELASHWFFKGFFEGNVFEVMGRTGIVDKYDNSPRVSVFDRWFLGGIDTLRGYRYRQVGPRDPAHNNEPLGGGTYWFGSAEYSIPIIEFLRVAVFYDIGMVYPDAYSFSTRSRQTGAGFSSLGQTSSYNDNYGIGLRLNIPRLGPLRLDYGIPIHADPYNKSSGRFQFSVGYQRDF